MHVRPMCVTAIGFFNEMTIPHTHSRLFRPTPDRLAIGLLILECLLWLSERYRWFFLNEHKGWTVLIALAAVGVALLLVGLWFVASLSFHWRFQFSILSLLLLFVVVSIPCGWLAARRKEAQWQKEVLEALASGNTKVAVICDDDLRDDGGKIPFVFSWTAVWCQQTGRAWNNLGSNEPCTPECLRTLLGEDFFAPWSV